MPTQHYHSSYGCNPNLEAAFIMSGPQVADQIDTHIQALLDLPGVTGVAVLFNHGQGDRVHLTRKIPDPESK